ncbi:hypothetical protein BGZ65_009857, partial [Modicella reniformis]
MGSTIRFTSLLVVLPILVHLYHKRTKKQEQQQKESQEQQHKGSMALSSAQYKNNDSKPERRGNGLLARHPEQVLVGIDGPYVASSVEYLDEAVLNLSDDEESFEERRRRQSNADSTPTWASERTQLPSSSSHTTLGGSSKVASAAPSPPSTRSTSQTKGKSTADLKLDTWIIRLGYTILSVTYIGYGLAAREWQFYISAALHAVGIIAEPSMKSLLTSLVEPSQYGTALGAIQVVDSISGSFSPMVVSWIYAATVKSRPDFV